MLKFTTTKSWNFICTEKHTQTHTYTLKHIRTHSHTYTHTHIYTDYNTKYFISSDSKKTSIKFFYSPAAARMG